MNLKGKNVLVTGIASNRSISYAISKILHTNGANVIITYQNDRLKDRVIKLKNDLGIASDAYSCDLSQDSEILTLKNSVIKDHGNLDGIIHSAAFAPKELLGGKYIDNITRDGFSMAHDISSYSLTALAKVFKDNLNRSSSIITLSYIGADRVVQNYNVMGLAKASLECSVKYLADSLGEDEIRVNAISAGPIKTLAASGIKGFKSMLNKHGTNTPLARNITAREVGDTATFLLSDMSSGITGQNLYVDGGYTIQATNFD
jgi:enoyl-[acyl-carrier protein] reductase I